MQSPVRVHAGNVSAGLIATVRAIVLVAARMMAVIEARVAMASVTGSAKGSSVRSAVARVAAVPRDLCREMCVAV